MHLKYIQKCRVCDNPHLEEVLDLGPQKSQGAFEIPHQKTLLPMRLVHSKLIRCNPEKYENACGLVQLNRSVPPEILYSSYFYRSSISQTMRTHLKEITDEASNLVGRGCTLTVMDCAANDLTLLKNYPSNYTKVAVDPSNITKEAALNNRDITVINKCFPCEDLGHYYKDVNIWTGIAFFYDIEDPIGFCRAIKTCLSLEGIGILEFAYLPAVLENLCYDGLVMEHIAIYSLATIERILKECGLSIFKAVRNDINGGSLQVWFSHSHCSKYNTEENDQNILNLKIYEFNLELDTKNPYSVFKQRVQAHSTKLKNLLLKLKDEGKIIHAYGMSTKLNCLLQFMGIGPKIIISGAERDSTKIGGKTLTGIPMISEEESRKTVDYYLVGPYGFKKEIIEREKAALEKGIKFIFPLPEIEII